VDRFARVLALSALALQGCLDDVGAGLGGGTVLVPLAAPSGLTATPRADGSAVDLAWTDNSPDETGYRLDVNDAPFGTTPTAVAVVWLPADAESTAYPAAPGQTLYFRVLAVTATLESDPSNTATATTPNVPPPPDGLTAVPVSTSRIDLAWSNPTGATGSRVQRTADGGASWATVYDGALRASFEAVGLQADTRYGFRVLASNADGWSGPSAPAFELTLSGAVTVATLASAGDVGRHASIGFDAGTEQISHYDATNTNVVLTVGAPGGAYATTTVDAGPSTTTVVGSNGTSLAIDPAGRTHIAACDTTSSDLRYITNSITPTGPFFANAIQTAGVTGQGPVIALSPAANAIHIVFIEGTTLLRRASKPISGPGGWSYEIVAMGEWFPPGFLSLALDDLGNPHVAFLEVKGGGSSYELRYAVKAGAAPWSFETVDAALGGFKKAAIAVDADRAPHVVYHKHSPAAGGDALFRAVRSSSWTFETVFEEPGRPVGAHLACAIDASSGRLHVAWYEALNRDLRYARKDPAGPWVHRILDAAGDVGQYPSIVASDGVVRIAYHDASSQDLKRAFGSP
jgi:hypothetical protein